MCIAVVRSNFLKILWVMLWIHLLETWFQMSDIKFFSMGLWQLGEWEDTVMTQISKSERPKAMSVFVFRMGDDGELSFMRCCLHRKLLKFVSVPSTGSATRRVSRGQVTLHHEWKNTDWRYILEMILMKAGRRVRLGVWWLHFIINLFLVWGCGAGGRAYLVCERFWDLSPSQHASPDSGKLDMALVIANTYRGDLYNKS